MTELPERLLSGVAGEWERALLESAQLDAPSVEFKRTFSRRLSIALSTAGVLVSGTSHALGGFAWLKWLAIGFVIGTAGAAGGGKLADSSKRDAPAASARSSTTQKRAAPLARTSPEPTAPSSQPSSAGPATEIYRARSVSTPPVAAYALATSMGSSDAAAASPAPAPALREEMAQLESIRAALSRGDAHSALRNLDAYDSQYSSGALSIEARVLRIEALVAAGESGAASALAQRFLHEHSGGPYTKRIRSLAQAESKANP
ncbi:MAG TPA: hypothetical protein VHM25_26425 [Polyangiaceae bacterium]|jgi:hypothetical protein|nr:hypothetical protein [Polyangiaceae bacterium]